jgi:hypothetical protein
MNNAEALTDAPSLAPDFAGVRAGAHESRTDGRSGSVTRSKGVVVGFWLATALLCLQMGFNAYAQLRMAEVAEAFAHLGFPGYFRVELAWAKLLGVVLLLAPVPARLKEWAYAGFAINLGSAVVAHLAVGDGPQSWGWAVGTGVLWGLSYFFWRRLESASAKG